MRSQWLISYGIVPSFDTIITIEDSIAPKSSAEPMLAYLDKTGVKSQEVFYIGDTVYDRECAAHAEVDFGLAMWAVILSNKFMPPIKNSQ